jgi:hypothetical protein
MVLRKFRFASSRCSAGELTLGELGSVLWLWEREERPLVNKLGRAAMVIKNGCRLSFPNACSKADGGGS